MERDPTFGQTPEMRSLFEAIDKKQFTALSPGLGLGQSRTPQSALQRTTADRPKRDVGHVQNLSQSQVGSQATGAGPSAGNASRRLPAAVSQPAFGNAVSAPSPSPFAGGRAQATAQGATGSVAYRLLLRLCAWSLDFLLVAASLVLAFGALVLVTRARGGVPQDWTEQRSVRWLLEQGPLVTIASVYGVLLVYGLVFKVMVGRTCGESLLGIAPKKAQASRR